MNAVVVTPNYPTRVDHGGPHHLIIVNTSMVRIRVGYAGRRIVGRALNPFDKPATRPAILSGFGRALQACQQSARGIANLFQAYSILAHVLGLAVGVYGQHTDRRKMKCPTKALKDLTK